MSICIIDGYNFVFRAYHSLPPLTTSQGLPVGAIYGFVNMLIKLIENEDSEMMLVALDSGKKTFRHEMYAEYKAHRKNPDEDLRLQFPIIREALSAINTQFVEIEGLEADDIIAAYTQIALKQNKKVKIISSDKDLIQLLQPGVAIIDPIKKKSLDNIYVQEKYGIKPEQMIDYLALVGDSSDNIPGVKRIGPKTAAKLLNTFGCLEEIYSQIEKVEPVRVQNLLHDSQKEAFLSKQLVILDPKDYKMPYTLEELKVKSFIPKVLSEFLAKYEFRSISTKRTFLPTHQQQDAIFKTIKINIAELEEVVAKIEYHQELFLYIKEGMVDLYFNTKVIYQIHFDGEFIDLLLNSVILRKVLKDPSIKKVFFDIYPIVKKCDELDVPLSNFDDIKLMFYTLYTGVKSETLEEIVDFLKISSRNTAYALKIIYKNLKLEIANRRSFSIYDTERRLMSLLPLIEKKGVNTDPCVLKNLSEKFKNKLNILEHEIFAISKEKFNIASPKQTGDMLFDKLGIKGGEKSKKTGAYTTDAETMEKLSSQGVTIAEKILQWRHYAKLINNYTDHLQNFIQEDGRIHTTFSITTTATGRLSSHSPNLQNIPIKTDEGNEIRRSIIAAPNHLIISADYSQIELRVIAHMADIKSLIDAFKEGLDIHGITASEIFNIPINQVCSNLRRKAKAINFGIIYGISSYGLANNLKISKTEAADYIEKYFQKYPGIKEYMDSTVDFAKKHGYVKTMLGRRCYLKNINSKNYALRNFSERAAINAPIQGTASEIIKKAMCCLDNVIKKHLILQIHDELLFEIPNNEMAVSLRKIKHTMENIVQLKVPLKIDVFQGTSWFKRPLHN